MSNAIMDGLYRIIGGNPSVRKVADDLQLTSELILLVRTMFADGELHPEELAEFKMMCSTIFGLSDEDIPEVLEYLKDFGYETTAWDAASMFAEMDIDRKKQLLLHMLEVAQADHRLDASETELIRKTAAILGLTADDIRNAV